MILPQALVAVIALLALTTGCAPADDGSDQAAPSSVPSAAIATATPAPTGSTPGDAAASAAAGDPTVREAIAAWLGARGITYAGPCSEASLPEDSGRYCSNISEDRGTTVVLMLGPTFSEFDSWILVQRGPNGWLVVKQADMAAPDDPAGAFEPPF